VLSEIPAAATALAVVMQKVEGAGLEALQAWFYSSKVTAGV